MTPYKNKCIKCSETKKEKMYNPNICKKCRTKWEKNPYLN